jgi:membrane-associated phospholipid phosphatase
MDLSAATLRGHDPEGPETVLELHSRTPVDDSQRLAPSLVGRWTRPLVIASFAIFVLLTVSVLVAAGPVLAIDKALAAWPGLYTKNSAVAKLLAVVGQRAYSAPVLIVVAAVLSWRRRIIRPMTLALIGLLALNVIVGAMKYAIARPSPRTGVWLPFTGGTDFPSGHTSNAVLTWGLVAWLLLAFGRKVPTIPRQWFGYGLVAAASVTVGIASLYLRTHWISDIVAGWAVGFLILVGVARLQNDDSWRDRLDRVEGVFTRFGRRSTVQPDEEPPSSTRYKRVNRAARTSAADGAAMMRLTP